LIPPPLAGGPVGPRERRFSARRAFETFGAGAPAGWTKLLLWSAIAVAVLQAIVGIAHLDREALAFAVLFAVGVVIIARVREGGRVYTATVIILGLLFADVAFWMIARPYEFFIACGTPQSWFRSYAACRRCHQPPQTA
jgi:hypothetical protein